MVTGGILGVAFAINSGAGAETALLLGLPIATLALIVKNIYNGMFIPLLCHKADAYAEVGDTRGIERMHLISGIGLSLTLGIIVTVSYLAGVNMVKGFLDAIPEFIKHGLSVATGIIPALGFAMLARLLINKKVTLFFPRFCFNGVFKNSGDGYCDSRRDRRRRDGQYAEICGLATDTCARSVS